MTRVPFLALAGAALLSITTAALAANDGQTPKSRNPHVLAQTSCGKDLKNVEIAQGSGLSTDSTTFTDVTGSEVSFNIGGKNDTCVLVNFSAQAFAPASGGKLMKVRALLDGGVESTDGDIQLVAESGAFSDAHAYNFLFTNVAPGAHSVKMQFERTSSGTDKVFINQFTAVVYHK